MSMVKSSHDAVYAHPPAVSSRIEVNLEKKDSTFDDNFLGVDTFGSSLHPTFLIQSVCPPSPSRAISPPSRRCKSKYHPKSINFMSLRDDGSQGHRNGSSQDATRQIEREEPAFVKRNMLHLIYFVGTDGNTYTGVKQKADRSSRNPSARKNLERTRDESSTLTRMSNLETPLPVKLLKHDKIPDTTSSAFSEHTGSKENHALNAGPSSLSSKNEVNQEKKDSSSYEGQPLSFTSRKMPK